MWVSERIQSHQVIYYCVLNKKLYLSVRYSFVVQYDCSSVYKSLCCFNILLQKPFVVACINFLVKKDHDPRPNLTRENIVVILACLQPYTLGECPVNSLCGMELLYWYD